MATQQARNMRLGLFVLAGTILLIAALYLIGVKQNLFGSVIRIKAKFYNVNGLMPGNGVRYAGIDIGTVENLEIAGDTLVEVSMLIKKSVQQYIHKNVVANVGTDGLMGNKLVNINPGRTAAPLIQDGDEIRTLRPVETDEVMRTLYTTNDNIRVITEDLRKITRKLNNSNTLWSFLSDSLMVANLKQAIVSIKITGGQSAIIAGDLGQIVQNIKSGKGSVGALLTDTTLGSGLKQAVVKINVLSDKLAVVSGDLSNISSKLKNGEGTMGALLMDTTFVPKLNKSLENIEQGSKGFSDNMEALKHSFLLRNYFKKQEKRKS